MLGEVEHLCAVLLLPLSFCPLHEALRLSSRRTETMLSGILSRQVGKRLADKWLAASPAHMYGQSFSCSAVGGRELVNHVVGHQHFRTCCCLMYGNNCHTRIKISMQKPHISSFYETQNSSRREHSNDLQAHQDPLQMLMKPDRKLWIAINLLPLDNPCLELTENKQTNFLVNLYSCISCSKLNLK